MIYVFGAIIFLFGSALGSFVTVIANRYNTGLSFWRGRSFCFSCNTELKNKDLFPFFSFLSLKGKCRYCGSKIPISAFIVEVVMGLLSLLVAVKIGIFDNFQFSIFNLQFILNFLALNFIFATILLISLYDLKHFIIPDSFLISLFIFSILHNSLFVIHNSFFPASYLSSLASGLVLALPFLIIFLVSRGRWLGFGDVKYIAVIGFLLGPVQGVSAVILSFWIGAAFSVIALSLQRIKTHIDLPLLRSGLTIKSEVPFGPFLSVGTVLSFYLNIDLFQIKYLLDLI